MQTVRIKRYPTAAASACFLLFAALGCEAPEALHPKLDNAPPLEIVVYYSTVDNHQGYSAARTAKEAAAEVIREGVSRDSDISALLNAAAPDKEAAAKAINEKLTQDYNVILVMREDDTNPTAAAEEARRDRTEPRILAVIGHSRTPTTIAALPYYAEAGIPVVMPSATSPYIPYKLNSNQPYPKLDKEGKASGVPRFSRVFRLPPKDVPDQTNAIAATTLRLLGTSHDQEVMLVCDTSNGAESYTRPICDALDDDPKLRPHIASYRTFNQDTGDIYGIVTAIHAFRPRYVIVISYPQVARVLLQEIQERSKLISKDAGKYTFIFSDSSMTAVSDLSSFGWPIFVTSSSRTLEDEESKSNSRAQLLKNHTKRQNVTPTDECYTFDAILLLKETLDLCKKEEINRACIAKQLSIQTHLPAGCSEYRFVDGESAGAVYHVFTMCNKVLSDIGPAEGSTRPIKAEAPCVEN